MKFFFFNYFFCNYFEFKGCGLFLFCCGIVLDLRILCVVVNYFLVVFILIWYLNLDWNGLEVYGVWDWKVWWIMVGGEKVIVLVGYWGGVWLLLCKDMGMEIEFGGCGMGGVIICMGFWILLFVFLFCWCRVCYDWFFLYVIVCRWMCEIVVLGLIWIKIIYFGSMMNEF